MALRMKQNSRGGTQILPFAAPQQQPPIYPYQVGERGLQQGQKHDPATNPVGPYNYQNGGLFAQPGMDARVFSAMAIAENGLIDALPIIRTPVDGGFGGITSPFFNTFTGVTQGAAESVSNQPTEPCDEGPSGGLLKLCTLTAQFGRWRFSIDPIDLETVGDLSPYATTNLQLVNPMSVDGFGTPAMASANTRDIFRNTFIQRAFASAYSAKRLFSQRLYSGNPSNSSASNYWKDITGLDIFINENNKRDAFSSNLCTALNSDIKDFGYDRIGGTGRDIVRYFDSVFGWLDWNASRMGLNPVEWVIAMRPELFDELVMIWPIRQYQEALAQIALFTNGSLNVPASETIAMRDEMRNGRFLTIRGRRVRVVLDEFIPERGPTQTPLLVNGQYGSDIYIVPLTVRGGIPVTYIQPYDMSNAIAEAIVNVSGQQAVGTFTSDGGLFRWYVYSRAGCLSWSFATRWRLLCHTPQLGARITNVGYQPLQHFRSSDPTSSYFADGGRTNSGQNPVKLYTDWGGSTPSAW